MVDKKIYLTKKRINTLNEKDKLNIVVVPIDIAFVLLWCLNIKGKIWWKIQ